MAAPERGTWQDILGQPGISKPMFLYFPLCFYTFFILLRVGRPRSGPKASNFSFYIFIKVKYKKV